MVCPLRVAPKSIQEDMAWPKAIDFYALSCGSSQKPAWNLIETAQRKSQQVVLLSGTPLSGRLVPLIDRYAHQANFVSIYQPFVISIDRSFLGKNTRIPILPLHHLMC
jgi:hypothetical protein